MNSDPALRLGSAIRFARLGLIAFMLGIAAAVVTYSDRFYFTRSYLSFLGQFKGTLLQWHAWLFNGSLTVFGVSLTWFFHSVIGVTKRAPGGLRWWAHWGRAGGVALILVAFTPVDVFNLWHNVAMSVWLICMVMSVLGWLKWQLGPKERQASVMARYVLVGVLVYPVAVAISLGPLLQKAIVVAAIGWLGHLFGQVEETLEEGRVAIWLEPPRTKKKRSKRPDVKFIQAPNRDTF